MLNRTVNTAASLRWAIVFSNCQSTYHVHITLQSVFLGTLCGRPSDCCDVSSHCLSTQPPEGQCSFAWLCSDVCLKSVSHTGYLQSLHVNMCTNLHIRSRRAAEWGGGGSGDGRQQMFQGAVAEEELRWMWDAEEEMRSGQMLVHQSHFGFLPRLKPTYLSCGCEPALWWWWLSH